MAIGGANNGVSGSNSSYSDPTFRRLLWHIMSSTKGGVTRVKMLDFINSQPANANQIATGLGLDYKTITHHLRVLSKNGLIITDNKSSYGATYFLSPLMEKNYESLKIHLRQNPMILQLRVHLFRLVLLPIQGK